MRRPRKKPVIIVAIMACAITIFTATIIFLAQADSKPLITTNKTKLLPQYQETKYTNPVETKCHQPCLVYDPDALNVHMIPHSHDDVGWLKTFDQYFANDVKKILTTVIEELTKNPDRRFIQVETAYFKKWWQLQSDSIKQTVIELVNNGTLEFVSGGWAMNDEAAVHYQSTVDQFTLGFRYLEDNLGECARPRTGWQIDPFGHSREQASISAQLGFDSMFFSRIDFRDKQFRLDYTKTGDLIWRGSQSLGNTTDIFTSVFLSNYFDPKGFCYDMYCADPEINDNINSHSFNQLSVVESFTKYVAKHADKFPTNNILVPMGGDFRFGMASKNYRNIDKLINGFVLFPQTYKNKPIRLFYSTPTCYTRFVHEYVSRTDYQLKIKTDDFFPYADYANDYWTGYFTSRPNSKRFERTGNNLLQVTKQLSAITGGSYEDPRINSLKEAMGIMQHHDAITGTEKDHVTKNYHLILANASAQASEASNIFLTQFMSSMVGPKQDFGFKSCLLVNVSSCETTTGDKFTVVVYNPLSRTVSGPISVPVNYQNWKILNPSGEEVKFQISTPINQFSYITDVPISRFNLDFFAQDIPALGYSAYNFEMGREEQHNTFREQSFIGFEDTNFVIDHETGLLSQITMNGVRLDVSQEFLYYPSADNSGAYIFSPAEPEQKIATGPVQVTQISGDVYQGVIQKFSDWAQQVIKIYNGDRSYIEFDWLIGPLDFDSHRRGKEVISRFSTGLRSEGIFYTDSNGRELLKRTRNSRSDYAYSDEQPISGNYYPANTRILIRDENQKVELAVLTDRSEGGSSIRDGQLELMVHRICHRDDKRGVGENLNENEYGQGIVVRGKHYVVLGKFEGDGKKSLSAIERDVMQRKFLSPWPFFTDKDIFGGFGKLQDNALNSDLPDNVQILTLEPWQDNVLLIRLEHVIAKNEDQNLSQEVTVDLSNAFTTFTVVELQETTLGGNILLDHHSRLQWPGSEQSENDSKVLSSDYRKLRNVRDLRVTLAPMQIRTFLAKIQYSE